MLNHLQLLTEINLGFTKDGFLLKSNLISKHLHHFVLHISVHLSETLLHSGLQVIMFHSQLAIILLEISNLCFHQDTYIFCFGQCRQPFLFEMFFFIYNGCLFDFSFAYGFLQFLMELSKLFFFLNIKLYQILHFLLEILVHLLSDAHHVLVGIRLCIKLDLYIFKLILQSMYFFVFAVQFFDFGD